MILGITGGSTGGGGGICGATGTTGGIIGAAGGIIGIIGGGNVRCMIGVGDGTRGVASLANALAISSWTDVRGGRGGGGKSPISIIPWDNGCCGRTEGGGGNGLIVKSPRSVRVRMNLPFDVILFIHPRFQLDTWHTNKRCQLFVTYRLY